MLTPEPSPSEPRANTYRKWARRGYLTASLVVAITFVFTTNPVPAARRAAVERGHDPARLSLRSFNNTNARWFGGSTTVLLRSAGGMGERDIDVVLSRPPWLFGWNVTDYAERKAGQ